MKNVLLFAGTWAEAAYWIKATRKQNTKTPTRFIYVHSPECIEGLHTDTLTIVELPGFAERLPENQLALWSALYRQRVFCDLSARDQQRLSWPTQMTIDAHKL